MNILFTYELAQRLEGTGVTSNALHPGFVKTGFGSDSNSIQSKIIGFLQGLFGKSPDEGAETSVYLASSPEVKGITGKYWANKKQKQSNAASYDQEAQRRLWITSELLTGLTKPTTT